MDFFSQKQMHGMLDKMAEDIEMILCKNKVLAPNFSQRRRENNSSYKFLAKPLFIVASGKFQYFLFKREDGWIRIVPTNERSTPA